MKIDIIVECVHPEITQNVEMEMIESDLAGSDFLVFTCPICHKETVLRIEIPTISPRSQQCKH